jgi:hypothetical protein
MTAIATLALFKPGARTATAGAAAAGAGSATANAGNTTAAAGLGGPTVRGLPQLDAAPAQELCARLQAVQTGARLPLNPRLQSTLAACAAPPKK